MRNADQIELARIKREEAYAVAPKLIKYADLGPGVSIWFVGVHKSDQMRPPFYVGNRFDHRRLADFPSLPSTAAETDLIIKLRDLYRNHDGAAPRPADVCEAARRVKVGLDRFYDDHQLLDYLAGATYRSISHSGGCQKRVQTKPPVPGFAWAA